MITTTRKSATTTTRHAEESRLQAAARHLYEAEVALHIAHQTGEDAWIAAAADKLHLAIVEHRAAESAAGVPAACTRSAA
jgi:hypothetical protein